MKRGTVAAVGLLALALAGCQDRITTPGTCPDLCPGDPIVIRDTTILAIPGGDSTFFGYADRSDRLGLLVSDGLEAGEYRAFVAFPPVREDSVLVDNIMVKLEVDSAAVTFQLQSRDTTATGLTLYLHRLPLGAADTTISYDSLQTLLAGTPVVDSIMVPDTLKTGRIGAYLTGDEIDKVRTSAADSGRVAFGIRLRASKPTGVRLGVDNLGSTNAPTFEYRGRVDVADTSKRRQASLVRPADIAAFGYVGTVDRSIGANPDLLYLGGPAVGRGLIRFAIPPAIKDSAEIVRATLELTPALPLLGLPNNLFGDSVSVRGIVADLGAKSPTLNQGNLVWAGRLREGTTTPVSIELTVLANQWQLPGGPPTVVFITHLEEVYGGGFMQPVFFSTRSPTGAPRLRITYGLPTNPGRP